MSIFNSRTILALTMLLLAACQSAPETSPAPEPTVEPAPVTGAAGVDPKTESLATEPAPEPIDFYQQFYTEAIASLKNGNTDRALELLVQVSTDAPDKPYIFTNLGLAYFKLQKLDLAEQAFQEAINRNNKDSVAYTHLGILQRYKGQFEEARNQYQRAIRIDSDYALAHLNLGILFDLYLQDLKLALQHYQKYQALIIEEDSQVAGWITDIQRRLKTATATAQG
jgi:tetratricopeptide (TPR) repeat protein